MENFRNVELNIHNGQSIGQHLLNYGCNDVQIENYYCDLRVRQITARLKDQENRRKLQLAEFQLRMIDPDANPVGYRQAKAKKKRAVEELDNHRILNSTLLESELV